MSELCLHLWELGHEDDPFVEVCPYCRSVNFKENHQSTRTGCTVRHCRRCEAEFDGPTLAYMHEVEWELRELEQRDAEFAKQLVEWRAYREAQRKVER